MDLPRNGEVAGTREIPAWELEFLARWGDHLVPVTTPDRPKLVFPTVAYPNPKGLDEDGSGS